MVTLQIEHPVTDFPTWRRAFDRFADRRTAAGVTAQRITQPVDDPRYVVLELDFPDVEGARAFLRFLESQVWSVPANSPGLAGSPVTRILLEAPQ